MNQPSEPIQDSDMSQCGECGLHYRDAQKAAQCELWCKAHHTCNVDITKDSEEQRLWSNSHLQK